MKSLIVNKAEALETNFTEEEVFKALCSLSGDKTPGPDGFSMLVYKKSRSFMKKEIMEVFHEFYRRCYYDWRLNTTFVTLITKLEGEKEILDHRPISLLYGVYKILGKVLAGRLKTVLNALISEFYCGGLHDRLIQVGILVAYELIGFFYYKSNILGLVLKIDLKKAFDTVSWSFMDKLMEKFGFGIKWRQWLKVCWSSSRFQF